MKIMTLLRNMKAVLLSLAILMPGITTAKGLKENPTDFHLGVGLATKYIWRGLESATAPVIAPTIFYNNKGFNVFVFGAYSFDGDYRELDYGLSYTYRWFTIGATDYFYPSPAGESDNYFNFKNKTTGHSIETYVTLAPEKVPLWLTLSTFIYGADHRTDGRQAYSSYAELGYNYNFKEIHNLSLTLGAALNKGMYTDYEGGFNVVNIELKYQIDIPIGHFSLPLSGAYILNPYNKKSYFDFGLSFEY